MRNSYRAALFLLLAAFPSPAQEISPKEWPKIAPLKKSFAFADIGSPAVDLMILGADGSPLYKLECRSADAYEGNDFDYSGDFECRLNSASGKDAYRTLLTYDPLQTRDYESRARFFLSDLEGKCGEYPEYGRVRTFRLRGMRLRLSLSFGSHGGLFPSNPGRAAAASLRMSVEARPDPSALTQIAEDVPYVDPAVLEPTPGTRTCSTVTPKHVPGTGALPRGEDPRLGPPFSPVTATEKTADIPPRDRSHSPKHPQPELAPAGDAAPFQVFFLPISAPGRGSGYEFECFAYGEPVGELGVHCGLYLTGSNVNLLAESVDPYTRRDRSIFLPAHLYGDCSAYPEWGSQRHFQLRGMRLVVEMQDVVFAPGKTADPGTRGIQRAKIHVRVEPDPGVRSPVATTSRVLDWQSAAGPGTCAQVLVNPRTAK